MKTETQLRAEEIWLHYYNRILLEKGLISESDWRKMNLKIQKNNYQ